MASFRSAQRKPYSRPSADVDGLWLHDRAPTGPAKMRNSVICAPIAPAASLNNKLVVSNLHYEITPKDLISIFGQIGTLIREPLLRVRHATELPLRKKTKANLATCSLSLYTFPLCLCTLMPIFSLDTTK
jgi:hypothetical protein